MVFLDEGDGNCLKLITTAPRTEGRLKATPVFDISIYLVKEILFLPGIKTSENSWEILTNEVGAGTKRVIDFKHLIVAFLF